MSYELFHIIQIVLQFTEQFAGQQLFVQVNGAQEIHQAAADLLARLNINGHAMINIHIGNNVDEAVDE